jgi:glycosyltransferase involved in cell wall biosynthesis
MTNPPHTYPTGVTSTPVDVVAIGHAPILQVNRRLYRALARMGWRIELVIPARLPWSADPNIVQADHPDDPPIHRLMPRGRNTRYWSFEGLEALLSRRQPRIVYLENNVDTTMAWTVGGWCRKNHASLILNSTENELLSLGEMLRVQNPKLTLRTLRSQLWGRFARSRIDHVVAMYQGGRRDMEMIGFRNAVTVAPLGFDHELFFIDAERRAATRKALGLIDPVVAYFGRMTRPKGVPNLVAALGRIMDQPWHFLIDEFEHDSATSAWLDRAIDEAGIRARTITFKASHDEIADYMRAADIVAMPSVMKEQYGRVAPEAMACGCAVVVSNSGALPELVGDAGIIVPAGDITALGAAIRDLLANPERRAQVAARGHARAHSQFSIDQQAAILDKLFHSELATPPLPTN